MMTMAMGGVMWFVVVVVVYFVIVIVVDVFLGGRLGRDVPAAAGVCACTIRYDGCS